MGKGIAIGLVVGILLTGLILNLTVVARLQTKVNKLTEEKLQLASGQQQSQHNQTDLASQVKSLTAEKDTCAAKFARGAILYESPLWDESRVWVLPVDVEPKIVRGQTGSYTH